MELGFQTVELKTGELDIAKSCSVHPGCPVLSCLPVGMGEGWRKLKAGHGWS